MSNSRIAVLACLATGLIAALMLIPDSVFQPQDPIASLPTADALQSPWPGDEGIPEWLAVPEGPFDPVLTQRVPQGRSLPPANHVVNDYQSEPTGRVQSEVSIAVHEDKVVIGWNDAAKFYGQGTLSGYAYSSDRGDTWVDGGSMPNGSGTDVYGDPSIAVTNAGHWVFASIDLGSPDAVAINHGDFSGGAPVWQPAVKMIDGSAFLDKEYLDYDPATNTLYLSYKNFGSGYLRLTRSTDGGYTWSSPTSVYTGGNANGAYPAAGVDGGVYVSWVDPLGSGNANMYVRYSPNGGQSWDPLVSVSVTEPGSGGVPRCFNRSFNVNFPSMGVIKTDGPLRGRACMIWTDGAPGRYNAFFAYSDDNGQTWSERIQLNDNANAEQSEQFWPQMHVAPDGRITAGWFDRRNETNNNSLCDYYITQSVDGGVTWGPNRRASDLSVAWCGVPADIAPNFGDYNDITSDERSVFAIWSDARMGDPDVLFARFDDRHLLAVTGDLSEAPTPFGGTGVAWFIPNEAELTADPAPEVDSHVQLAVASLGMGLFASPQETDGIFSIGGEALSGTLTLTEQGHTEPGVEGSFSISRSGPSGIDFDFSAVSDPDLGNIIFLPVWTTEAILVGAGPGQVTISGTVRMSTFISQRIFELSGEISLDGAPGVEFDQPHGLSQQARLNLGTALALHTRTLVSDEVVIAVEPISLPPNPYPLATVGVSPNPYRPGSRVRYTLTHPGSGTIRIYDSGGRLVRTIADQYLPSGSHTIPFDGRDNAGRALPSGGYFIQLQTGLLTVNGKLFIVK